MIEKIKEIFESNKNKRICVIGTTCTGKSFLIDYLGMGLDMDDEIFPLLTDEENAYVCQTPWTKEIGAKMDELVRTRLEITPGNPMFGTVLIDCDLIVYLHISEDLLQERCLLRDVDFVNAKKMQSNIEEEINNSNIECIRVEVENFIKTK